MVGYRFSLSHQRTETNISKRLIQALLHAQRFCGRDYNMTMPAGYHCIGVGAIGIDADIKDGHGLSGKDIGVPCR